MYQFLRLFSRLLAMFLVFPVHESAHGLAAKWMGDDTAERAGRITLNPFAHLDPIGSILILLCGFGWAKPVPVNPLNMRKYRQGIAVTAIAGPVSNLLFALATGLIYNLLLCIPTIATAMAGSSPVTYVLLVLRYLFEINIGLAVFNLLPIPPLDGFNVLRCFTNDNVDRWFYEHQSQVTLVFFIVILVLNFIPARFNPLNFITSAVSDLMWKAVSWIPRLRYGL